MSFGQAVQTCFSKYVDWKGRAGRAEFWWWFLFVIIVEVVVQILWRATGSAAFLALYIVIALALILPGIAVTVRRLHDTGRSGWWYWIALIPIVGGIILLVFMLMRGTPGPNRYGPGTDGGYPGGAAYPPPPGYPPAQN